MRYPAHGELIDPFAPSEEGDRASRSALPKVTHLSPPALRAALPPPTPPQRRSSREIHNHHHLPSPNSIIPSDPILYLPPLLSPLPTSIPHHKHHGPNEETLSNFETRLPDIDPASLELHQALHSFTPVDAGYAAKHYDEAFNWDELVSGNVSIASCVGTSMDSANSKSSASHKRPRENGTASSSVLAGKPRLSRSTFTSPTAKHTRKQSRTAVWSCTGTASPTTQVSTWRPASGRGESSLRSAPQGGHVGIVADVLSRRHAVKAISGPKHIEAMRHAKDAYEVYDLERWILTKEEGEKGLSLRQWQGGDVGW
jgi:hypothetical protein